MYAFINGTVEEINPDCAVIDAGGVGYQIFCDLFTLSSLRVDQSTKVFTSLQTTKDGAMTLYGFADKQTKRMFELLLTVSGIGAKGALKILSKMSAGDIVLAIASENDAAFRGAASPQVAARIIVDLRKKIQKLGIDIDERKIENKGNAGQVKEASDALVGLGYTRSKAMEASKAVAKEGMSVEDIIFQALKQGDQS